MLMHIDVALLLWWFVLISHCFELLCTVYNTLVFIILVIIQCYTGWLHPCIICRTIRFSNKQSLLFDVISRRRGYSVAWE